MSSKKRSNFRFRGIGLRVRRKIRKNLGFLMEAEKIGRSIIRKIGLLNLGRKRENKELGWGRSEDNLGVPKIMGRV